MPRPTIPIEQIIASRYAKGVGTTDPIARIEQRLAISDIRELANDLIRTLAGHIGDREAIDRTMRRYVEVLDVQQFGFVAMAAVQSTFTDHLRLVDPADVPAGATAFTSQKENQ